MLSFGMSWQSRLSRSRSHIKTLCLQAGTPFSYKKTGDVKSSYEHNVVHIMTVCGSCDHVISLHVNTDARCVTARPLYTTLWCCFYDDFVFVCFASYNIFMICARRAAQCSALTVFFFTGARGQKMRSRQMASVLLINENGAEQQDKAATVSHQWSC